MTRALSHTVNDSISRKPGDFCGLRVHLVGVGGCGMSGAAGILLQSEAIVSGSDQASFAGVENLVQAGAAIHIGHRASHVCDDVELVVYSAAIPETNSEIVATRYKGIPVLSYAELLGEISESRLAVSVSGTHGKSTTTALVAHIFRTAGLEPSFIVGANCKQLGGNSGVGTGPHFIVESCEYARSFLHMKPHSAAILNIEADHLDCYRDLDDIVSAFGTFARQVSPDGLLVVNHDDPEALRAAEEAVCRIETFGFQPGADWQAANLNPARGCFAFDLIRNGRLIAPCRLALAGKYNVGNALAAAALASEAGASPENIAAAMASFNGIARRMTLRGSGRGVTVVDDYAHHPTEIKVTLRAVHDRYEPKRVWVVFQPHQASRTRQLMDGFAHAFVDADMVLVPDVYCVRDTEEDRRAIGSLELVDRICSTGKQARYLPSFDEVSEYLFMNVTEGDLVVTMGAGDVWKVADGLVQRIC